MMVLGMMMGTVGVVVRMVVGGGLGMVGGRLGMVGGGFMVVGGGLMVMMLGDCGAYDRMGRVVRVLELLGGAPV